MVPKKPVEIQYASGLDHASHRPELTAFTGFRELAVGFLQ